MKAGIKLSPGCVLRPGQLVRLRGGPVYKTGSRFRLAGVWRVVSWIAGETIAVTCSQVIPSRKGPMIGQTVTVRITGPERPSPLFPGIVDRPYKLRRLRKRR